MTGLRAFQSWVRGLSAALTISENVQDLSEAAMTHGTQIECLVEIDCGAGRCGPTTPDVVAIAKAIDAAEGLRFAGLQAYQGAMQHLDSYRDRKAKIDIAVTMVKDAVATLKDEGLGCDIVGGGGTAPIILKEILGFSMSCSAVPTRSWMLITDVSSTLRESRGSG